MTCNLLSKVSMSFVAFFFFFFLFLLLFFVSGTATSDFLLLLIEVPATSRLPAAHFDIFFYVSPVIDFSLDLPVTIYLFLCALWRYAGIF